MRVSQGPTKRQVAVLLMLARSGGFCEFVADEEAAQECVSLEWINPEGETGYGLTIEGSIVVRKMSN